MPQISGARRLRLEILDSRGNIVLTKHDLQEGLRVEQGRIVNTRELRFGPMPEGPNIELHHYQVVDMADEMIMWEGPVGNPEHPDRLLLPGETLGFAPGVFVIEI